MNDTDAIDGRRQEWVAVVNARDPAGYAALFTPDGVWVPPGQPAVRGREAIRAWVRETCYLTGFCCNSGTTRENGG
ncbi:MAG: SgcJ/EcaC family oxidoreductase [Gemmatimonadetes bacterium]|nr:SgcJ/EcaC family oxidoreductase [Gemmatimonadota bacterium]